MTKLPEKVKVKITKKNIREGRPSDANHCVIALGVKESLHLKKRYISVEDASTINLRSYNNEILAGYKVTKRSWKKVQDFIDKFDRYGRSELKPITFTLERTS